MNTNIKRITLFIVAAIIIFYGSVKLWLELSESFNFLAQERNNVEIASGSIVIFFGLFLAWWTNKNLK